MKKAPRFTNIVKPWLIYTVLTLVANVCDNRICAAPADHNITVIDDGDYHQYDHEIYSLYKITGEYIIKRIMSSDKNAKDAIAFEKR